MRFARVGAPRTTEAATRRDAGKSFSPRTRVTSCRGLRLEANDARRAHRVVTGASRSLFDISSRRSVFRAASRRRGRENIFSQTFRRVFGLSTRAESAKATTVSGVGPVQLHSIYRSTVAHLVRDGRTAVTAARSPRFALAEAGVGGVSHLFLDVVVFSFTHCLIASGVDEIHRRLHQTRINSMD